MITFHRRYMIAGTGIALLMAGALALPSQTAARRGTPVIRQRIDDSRLVRLPGNVRPEATAANDIGAAPDATPLDHMLLQLQRSPEQERTVEQFVASQYDPASPNFHKWMTATDFGATFGPAKEDIQAVTNWLESYGFTVNTVYPSGMVVDFSGNAGQIRRAFHTSIHSLQVNGVAHIANFGDPQIPEALAPVVRGVVSMHDFRPHRKALPAETFGSGSSLTQALTPEDLATIYDLKPLFSQGLSGKGQTIAVIEDSDFRRTDWVTFRTTFGLSAYTDGSLALTNNPAPPSGANNCSATGTNSDAIEAALDAEWASAAAPSATIVLTACADTQTTSGLLIAMQNLVNGANPPPIMSISYGSCEAGNGSTANAALNSVYQQAAAEGMSVFVASGDNGAAGCDYPSFPESSAIHGIGVDAFASTPYNVAVGGTDFADTYNGNSSAYWNSSNTANYGSAKSYIPEIPWNGSCASSLLAVYNGYSTGYGAGGFCNSDSALVNGYRTVSAGSGGPSNCATGAPSVGFVASGSCKGYDKPSWQHGVDGIANDGVRDVPDVSMFASNGIWGHYAIMCFSDDVACRGDPKNWTATGGTSLAAPVMAGIQAAINQQAGGKQGNPNPVYYALAARVPGVFHPTLQGDIAVNCDRLPNCYGLAGTPTYGRNGRVMGTTYSGALSLSNDSFQPAYAAGTNWNFATGLGSVDANNLVMNWSKGQ